MKKTTLFICVIILASVLDQLSCVADGWGHLKGQIKVTGQVPEIPNEIVDKDQATCLADGAAPKDDNLIVGKNQELRDVFVMMYLKNDDDKPAVHRSYEESKDKPVVIDNVKCRFEPHALFVRTGQVLRMKNSDDVGHNCHVVTFNNEHNINLAQGASIDVKLEFADKTPGNVVCDIHKWMDAVLLVRDEPYAGITDKDGKFSIQNVPAGTWRFQFWHKKCGYLRKLEVPNYKVGRRGDIEVTIEDGQTLDLGQMSIPAAALNK